MASTKRSASPGGTAIPAPDASSSRGTSVPSSMVATAGRPAARIEYTFDGTLTRPSPERSGTVWTSPVASTSLSLESGTYPAKRMLAIPRDARSRSARAAPSPLIRTVTSGHRRATSTSSSSDWDNPTLPAYSTTGSSPMPSSARYGVMRSPGRTTSVSTKLGIVTTVAPGAFADTLAPRSSESTVTASARR